MTAAALLPFEPEGRGRGVLWCLAGLCVAALHGGLLYAVLNPSAPPEPPAEAPAAIMVELAPLPVAPDVPEQDVAPGPPMVMSQAATPAPDQEVPEETEEEPVAEAEVPPIPVQPSDAMITQVPMPEPAPERPRAEKRKPVKPKEARSRPQDRSALNAPATAAPQAAPVRNAATNAAPSVGMAASVSPTSWRNRLVAHLNRHKRYPPGAGRGTATLAFVIGADGAVRSARLARSSGDAALDSETLALAQRASPVPAPPPDLVQGGTMLLAVPIRFGN
ncbi:cell envelope biogenesis protein TonB [Azorhizobium oxalatiphilum]|uniref:Cell envelope biogenesis protein TonB n=1 Tax=Azorhizobium oxalatiphilum TaxID=980631 RepID=A0A917BMY9_9HYPH|nr:energy transducer TonB [Azorhizobium oxalatiphilum]GGF51269.1 cell envelope biogenesis protein TonB [Azorhizobium oxalatiphilum]